MIAEQPIFPGSASDGMAGGLMAGGDQTAVTNRFGGGVVAASGVAGGGGGHDEKSQSQTVSETAPELEQTPMSAVASDRLAESDSDREGYASPGSEEDAAPDAGTTESNVDSASTESQQPPDRVKESPSDLENPQASDVHFEEVEREELGEAVAKMDDKERGKLLYDVMNKSRTVDQAQGDAGNKYLRGMGGDAVKSVAAAGVGIAATGGAAPVAAAGAVAGAAALGAGQAVAGTGIESITDKISEGKAIKNAFRSELTDLKSEISGWMDERSVKTGSWRTGDGDSGSEANVGDTDGKDAIRNN
ncbi:hypothetical protein [Halorhabdus salina]|uniref:hypothetical protein n=1 Tax=Halorhabdus salina TaxID=2750670 RepID=UPI0015EE76A4|nr:hypothetical protein [Halorhabdus salina]